jgi:hypothetical protein
MALKGTYDGSHAVLLELFSLISSLSHQEGREQFVVTAMSGSNGRNAHIYRPKGKLNGLDPHAMWRTKEVIANVGCPREVEEIETLQKAGPVQRRRDHSAPPGSQTPIRNTLTLQGSAVTYHIVRAS